MMLVERIGNEIFVNGIKVATVNSYTITSDISDIQSAQTTEAIEPRTGWVWSEDGDSSDYESIGSATIHNVTLEENLKTIGVGALALVLVSLLHLKPVAEKIADKIISAATTAFIAYQTSKVIYSVESEYDHKYAPFNKMVEYEFYFNGDLDDEVPGSRQTLYGWWG